MKRCAFVLFVLFLSTCPAYGETARRRPQRETWYDQALRRINPENIDYGDVSGLSNEARQRLRDVRPETLGQAARIPGLTPAAVSLLLVHLKKRDRAA